MTRNGLILLDFIKGTSVVRTKRFLDQSQHWTGGKFREYQLEKLVILLASASEDVPFYKDLYKEQDLKEISSVQDFEGLPVVDRKMTMEAGEKLLSEKINLKKCKVGRTGGTTGPPLRLFRDTETRSFSLAAYYRFYNWMGIEPGMAEIEFWGTPTIQNSKFKIQNPNKIQNLKLKTQNYLNRFRSYNAFSFNDAYLEEVVKKLQRFQPKLIRGYLSAILLLADYIKRNNITGIRPIAVSCTSETLFPEYRKMIEEVFQAPLFNQYGCGECNSIAFECKEHNGMHITMEHCILEADEKNNLIVTNLDNHSQPFIRYQNGDLGTITDEPCACGYAGPRLTKLHGRTNENIILKDGASVNGIFFANLLDEAGFINNNKMLRFQIVQDAIGEIEFRAEVKKELETADLNKLKDALMPFFGKVNISQHSFLDPGPGGKFRYLISSL
ncbi:MAG: phenylacetate--CoA ligase family protein [Bacteroidetes bacterium]|nr:phenylacetate--CoA ligase family protein [Bacteroidota bacterium]